MNLLNNIGNNKYSLKKTFHTSYDGKCLGDKITFNNKQKCPECGQEIDVAELCFNFKNMRKDCFWVKCTICEQYILPKLGVFLGTEIISKEKDENIYNNYYSCNYTKFILHSPYELKINIKKIKKKDKFKTFHIESFKQNYPSLYWSCVWYFKLYKIDLDILLPYEWQINQELFDSDIKYPINIKSITFKNKSINEKNVRKIKKRIKNQKKCKKYSNDDLIVHSVISTYISNNYEDKSIRSSCCYNIRKSDGIYSANSNKSTINSSETVNNKKREYYYSCRNIPSRVRLNALTSSYLLSPILKPRQIYEFRNTDSSLLSIEENEEGSFSVYRGYKSDKALFVDKSFNINSNSNSNTSYNYKNFNIKLNAEFMAGRKKTFEKIKPFKLFDYGRNNSAIIHKNQNQNFPW